MATAGALVRRDVDDTARTSIAKRSGYTSEAALMRQPAWSHLG
jgi:hypothetical protein